MSGSGVLLQAAKPFSERTKEYIARLDVDRDEQTLAAHGLTLRPECNRIRKVDLAFFATIVPTFVLLLVKYESTRRNRNVVPSSWGSKISVLSCHHRKMTDPPSP